MLALDTSIFIYQFESNPVYQPLTEAVFAWLERPGHAAVTSMLTLTELLVQPYRDRDPAEVGIYAGLLATFPSLEWKMPDREIATQAAKIRAQHRLRTPDAIQAATAVAAGATALVTNDTAFRRVAGFTTIVLDDYR